VARPGRQAGGPKKAIRKFREYRKKDGAEKNRMTEIGEGGYLLI
jgi:hypothetical protein